MAEKSGRGRRSKGKIGRLYGSLEAAPVRAWRNFAGEKFSVRGAAEGKILGAAGARQFFSGGTPPLKFAEDV